MKNQLSALIVVSFLFAGCATSVRTVSHYPLGQFPATQPTQVMIMTQAPQRPYDVIGEILVGDVYRDGTLHSWDEKKMRVEIAALGGDAVLLNTITECRDMVLPERTVITKREGRYGKKHKKQEEITEVSHYPAQVQPVCHSRGVGQVLKFKDGVLPFDPSGLISHTAIPIPA